ncbi:MAG: hypothetical protein IJ711_02915, partial [Lachnospiraceae bacterium]|nr:hypothetical protein [Lachnospiraceae bacterium]
DTKVYDNFSVVWTLEKLSASDASESSYGGTDEADEEYDAGEDAGKAAPENSASADNAQSGTDATVEADAASQGTQQENALGSVVYVTVNQQSVKLSGKKDYIFVDVFDYIDFDLSRPQGTMVVLKLNGKDAAYTDILKTGDILQIYWAK